ncbi:MAG: hypothetical protein Q9201_002218 [Fulgogasparrea decipioides]
MDELVDPVQQAPLPPQFHVIEPPPARRQDKKQKPKKVYDGLKLVFDFHIPFTSHNKKKNTKSKKEHRRDEGMDRPGTPRNVAVPSQLQYPAPPIGHQSSGMAPVPPPPPPNRPPIIQPTHVTPPVSIHSNSTNSSPSLMAPIREHRRPRARSLSLTRQYEERKQAAWERERREHAERVAIAENERRVRAEREAEQVRRHNEDLRARERRIVRHRIETAERERRRRSQEEQERLAAAIVARRRRQELDRRRADQAMIERQRRAEARQRREEDERLRRIQEDRDRQQRQRNARIPRGPRHAAVIHHHHHHHHHDRGRASFEQQAREDFEQRGDRVINDAMRRYPSGTQPRWPADNGPRRRGTIAAAERRFYDDDRRRWGRRWF